MIFLKRLKKKKTPDEWNRLLMYTFKNASKIILGKNSIAKKKKNNNHSAKTIYILFSDHL